MRWARLILDCAYIGIPAAPAIGGNKHEYAGWYFAALAVTLPCGTAGFIGIYGGYAFIKGVGGYLPRRRLRLATMPRGSVPRSMSFG